MGPAYSADLRKRVLADVLEGFTIRIVAARYDFSPISGSLHSTRLNRIKP